MCIYMYVDHAYNSSRLYSKRPHNKAFDAFTLYTFNNLWVFVLNSVFNTLGIMSLSGLKLEIEQSTIK